MKRLELRGRAGKHAPRSEHAPDLGQQRRRPTDVLQHLLAIDEIEALVCERNPDAVEGLEPRVIARALAGLA